MKISLKINYGFEINKHKQKEIIVSQKKEHEQIKSEKKQLDTKEYINDSYMATSVVPVK